MQKQFDKLVKFNAIMGALHFIQGILMLVLSFSVIQKLSEFSPEIYQYYQTFNIQTMSLETASKVLFNLPFGIMVSLFLFASAAAHLIIVLNKNKYIDGLNQGINRFRWYEYAISSSIMITLIATLFGIYDIGTLLLIFGANAAMNLFGLLMEQVNLGFIKANVKWSPFVFGAFIGFIPWLVILFYMLGNGNYDMIPWFVWAIVITYFVAFNCFAINMILQYKGIGKWRNYLYGERAYIILSLVAKSLLAWLVLFGALQP